LAIIEIFEISGRHHRLHRSQRKDEEGGGNHEGPNLDRTCAGANTRSMLQMVWVIFYSFLPHGCQIFLGTTYQKGKNIPNENKTYHLSNIK
jgi:hypothetical protein